MSADEPYSQPPIDVGLGQGEGRPPAAQSSIDAAMAELSGRGPLHTAEAGQRPRRQPPAPVTTAIALVCIGVYLGLLIHGNGASTETLLKFGMRMPGGIWDGAYWALITPAFIHYAGLHLYFNLSALWVLGRFMEPAIGSWRFLAFYLAAAPLSASFQLAAADETGVGASGAICAIFGFMWIARWRYRQFQLVLSPQTIRFVLAWLVFCVVLTYFQILNIGNAAHFSGLAFGVLVGAIAIYRDRRKPLGAALALFVAAAVIPLFWAPWSPYWLGYKGAIAHRAQRFDEAIGWYTRAIEIDPSDATSMWNRGLARAELGQTEAALADMTQAREIEPRIGRHED
ncbi:MAG: tetratricopeptide repeat protein [Planctomycetales bacterium]|nr:tetratricopeptide repeat protein [Planctomycetales bacterium]